MILQLYGLHSVATYFSVYYGHFNTLSRTYVMLYIQ